MPRLARIGGAEPAPPLPLLGGSARSTAEYRQLLARLGAWMSFRAAARLIRELFPLASGGCADTVRRRIFAEADRIAARPPAERSEEHTSELQSLMRISYAVYCLKKKKPTSTVKYHHISAL